MTWGTGIGWGTLIFLSTLGIVLFTASLPHMYEAYEKFKARFTDLLPAEYQKRLDFWLFEGVMAFTLGGFLMQFFPKEIVSDTAKGWGRNLLMLIIGAMIAKWTSATGKGAS